MALRYRLIRRGTNFWDTLYTVPNLPQLLLIANIISIKAEGFAHILVYAGSHFDLAFTR